MTAKKHAVALLLASVTAASADTLAVLFVGNSHTYVNDLPGLFLGLSESGNRPVRTEMSAFGGYSLEDHTLTLETMDKIARDSWDFVALQEQSIVPTIRYWRYNSMYPAARLLDSAIRSVAAQAVFYMTWGWKYGGMHPYRDSMSMDFHDYFEMQDSVSAAYQEIASELGAVMAPVGLAWRLARTTDSLVDLWQADTCHATLKGTYLAACVFYAKLHRANPVGLAFNGGLTPEDALLCQQVAWQTVAGIKSEPALPEPAAMLAPSVFSSGNTVRFALPGSSRAHVRICDLSGRVVSELPCVGGAASWNGCDGFGRNAPPGIYLCLFDTRQSVAILRLTLVR